MSHNILCSWTFFRIPLEWMVRLGHREKSNACHEKIKINLWQCLPSSHLKICIKCFIHDTICSQIHYFWHRLHSEHCYVWHSYTNIFMSMDRIVPTSTMLVKLKCAYYTYVGVNICWPTFALFSELVSRGRKIRPALPLPTQFWAKKFN